MTAPVEVRAQRRLAQYQKTGVVDTKSLGDIRLDLEARDRCDETRSDSPLVCVPDAYVVDTSLLDEEEVPTLIVNLWQQL
jgi:cytidylate kinase